MSNDWRVEHRDGARLPLRLREQSLAALATAQHGVVARAQLLELRFTRREIGGRIASDGLRPLHHGVYAVGHSALSRHGRWTAATLAGGDGALLSHRPAGALRELVPPPDGRIDICVAGACGRSFPELRVHRRATLTDADRDEIDGIPVTSLPRTLLDLAAVGGQRLALEACERSLELRTFDLRPLAELLDRCAGQRGTRPLAAALSRLTDDPDLLRSELEKELRWRVTRSSLPDARHNLHVPGASGRLHECDLVWTEARLIVEADGRAFHASRAARERDERKQADLEAGGWVVERVGWADATVGAAATLARFDRLLRERVAI